MQGNKKQADGQSDSSSIGSLLDDTDREVCSLTDRAFKSLCVAELEAAYTESDPAVSSNVPPQFSSKFFHGPQNYVIRENTDSKKRLSKMEEHSTFQQFPKDAPEDKKASASSAPNISRKLGLPMPALRSYKHTSKVSSLIKTFDKPSLEVVKHPVKNSLTECPLVFGGNMALWGGKAILNFQNELSGFSDTCQVVANAGTRHGIHKRHNKMDLVCQGPYSFYFSQAGTSKTHLSPATRKTVKNRTGKAREPTRRGSFLHSENSAFESWNAHHKKLAEVGGSTEIIPKGRHLTYFEEAPFLQQSGVPERKRFLQGFAAPKILAQDISEDFSQKSEASLSPAALAHPLVTTMSKVKDIDSQILLPQASDLSAYVYKTPTSPSLTSSVPRTSKAPISPPPPQASVLPDATSQAPNTQTLVPGMTLESGKATSLKFHPGLENFCPPWRKQKTTQVGMGLAQDGETEALKKRDSSHRKPSDLMPLAKTTTVDSQVALSDPLSSNFNISELLTPVIPPKQENEPSEEPLLLISPPLSEAGATREAEERVPYSYPDNYKSKAPSLLFNLKDIRKRVKSTYSPSPLLRALEDKKKIKEPDNMKANAAAVNMLEEGTEQLLDNDERSHQPSEQMDSVQEKDNATILNGNYLTWSAPKSKADAQHYQNRHRVQQSNSVGISDSEIVSVTELHPDEQNGFLPSNYYFADATTDQEGYVHSLHLQGPKNEKSDLNQNSDVEPEVSPHLFFTAEENTVDNENQPCSRTGNEPKGKRSTSSSEHSFVSIIDQPCQNEEPYSLMQLFQKACLQESQRQKHDMSGEEKLDGKETEKTERGKELDYYLLNNYDSNTEVKHEKKEQSESASGVQRTTVREKKEDGWKNMDSTTEDKPEEPLTPTSSNSSKPNLFMIKDNTFKSSPVIKTVKLPLLRSVSCEDTTVVNHSESEKQAFGPIQATPSSQETDLSLSRISSQQNASGVLTESEVGESSPNPVNLGCQVAKKGNPTAECTLAEEQGSFYEPELIGEEERANIISALSQKDLGGHEKLTKTTEKNRTGKPKMTPGNQQHLGLQHDIAQNKQTSPTREKTSYLKNDVFSKRRGGSCMKKIITQEMGSVMASENPRSSPAFSDTFGHISTASGNLASSTLLSPRCDSMEPSPFTSPLSDTTATSNVSQVDKIANSLLHGAIDGRHEPSVLEAANPVEASQHSGEASSSPVSNGRQQLMGRMVKTAAKPPAVPPKTEKALRRAKKLASKRKKIEAQQKRPQDESASHCTDIAHSQLIQPPLSSPVCPNSPLIPSESNLRLRSRPLLSPTPSLPETQRKLLQDPDSGEYFLIDLPMQLKTFYDPETGRYVQVSIPPSHRNLSQITSAEIPPSAFVLYPSTLPLRVSSVPVLASPSQFSEPASCMQGTLSKSDWEPGDRYLEPQGSQACIEPAVSDGYSQQADGIEGGFEKDVSLSANADIISTGAIEDFAVEGIL